MPHAYEHVVFDLDGTLVDSRADLAAAVNHLLHNLGLPELPLDTISSYVGEGVCVLVQRALGVHQDRFEQGLDLFLGYYRAHLLDHTRPYPGVADMLLGLGVRGVTLSVLSNKPAALCRAILEGLGLLSHFIAVVGGDSVLAHKPDAAGVHHLRALAGTSLDRMLLVGDSAIDAQTARAAGVAFCGVGWGLAPDSLRHIGVQAIVEQATELLAVVAHGPSSVQSPPVRGR